MFRYYIPFLALLSLTSIKPVGASLSSLFDGAEGEKGNIISVTPKRNDDPYANATAENIESIIGLAATPCINGFANKFACQNVDLEAFLNLTTFSSSMANDIWGWTDSQSGKEYAILGLFEGTAFIDISNSSSPVYLGKLMTHTVNSSWRDMKTYADHAFIVSEGSGHGMQVFDLSQLRNVDNPPVTFFETAHVDIFGNARNIVMNEDTGLAIVVGSNKCSGGLYMVDVTNPTSPINVGCYSDDGYTYDAQCVLYRGPSIPYQGKEICVVANKYTITMVDITVRSSPVVLSRLQVSESAHIKQGWLTEDHAYFLAHEEQLNKSNKGQTYVFDVSDLTNITLNGKHNGTRNSGMHNEYVKGRFLYQATYGAGLTILDISNTSKNDLEEVAFFDTYKNVNETGYNGFWSNYPFFQSGLVIASGIEQGLFVLRPNTSLLPAPSFPIVTSTFDDEAGVFIKNIKFQPMQLHKDNWHSTSTNLRMKRKKIKITLQVYLGSTTNETVSNATVRLYVIENDPRHVKSKRTDSDGMCTFNFRRKKQFTMSILQVNSTIGRYDAEKNGIYNECPVFSSECPRVKVKQAKISRNKTMIGWKVIKTDRNWKSRF